ncbi:MAG: hypothetical protein IKO39_11945 [Treponema sp.]|nr:hypothetical protein [Treponema sp.]
MEKEKIKTETVILPDPNQMILLRKMQKEIGGIPVLPVCLRCQALTSLSDKITKAEPKDIFEKDGKIILRVEMEINGKVSEGRILLCERAFSTADSENVPYLSDYPLKKLSPFRIAKMETEELPNGRRWKILEEKWCKIK